jgi:hypothetical protein
MMQWRCIWCLGPFYYYRFIYSILLGSWFDPVELNRDERGSWWWVDLRLLGDDGGDFRVDSIVRLQRYWAWIRYRRYLELSKSSFGYLSGDYTTTSHNRNHPLNHSLPYQLSCTLRNPSTCVITLASFLRRLFNVGDKFFLGFSAGERSDNQTSCNKRVLKKTTWSSARCDLVLI